MGRSPAQARVSGASWGTCSGDRGSNGEWPSLAHLGDLPLSKSRRFRCGGCPWRRPTDSLFEWGFDGKGCGAVSGPCEAGGQGPWVVVSRKAQRSGPGWGWGMRAGKRLRCAPLPGWPCPPGLPFPSQNPPFWAPADASDAKARERRRGGPLPTASSKEASEAKDPRYCPWEAGAPRTPLP